MYYSRYIYIKDVSSEFKGFIYKIMYLIQGKDTFVLLILSHLLTLEYTRVWINYNVLSSLVLVVLLRNQSLEGWKSRDALLIPRQDNCSDTHILISCQHPIDLCPNMTISFKGPLASILSKSATNFFFEYWRSSSSKLTTFHLDWHQYAHILRNPSRACRKIAHSETSHRKN